MKKRLAAGVLGVGVMVSLSMMSGSAFAAAPGPSETQLVSVSSTGVVGDKPSGEEMSISADGRYVAFSSWASNVSDVSTNGVTEQVFVRDTVAGTTQLISANGSIAGDRDSTGPSVSADGSVVAYISSATNLVASARTGIAQVFVWSRATGVTQLATLSNDVVPAAANAASYDVDISGDGKSVAFTSRATNLTSENTWHFVQLYKRDLAANLTTMVSLGNLVPGTGTGDDVSAPEISSDGRLVAFTSRGSLTGVAPDGRLQVYTRDTVIGETRMASVNVDGTSAANQPSSEPSLSSDGRFVAFCSDATDLTAETSIGGQAYVRDLQSGVTKLASHDVSGTRASSGGCFASSISGDGKTLAEVSIAKDLVPDGWAANGKGQAYVIDLPTGKARLASVPFSGSGLADGSSFGLALSEDGRVLAFSSQAKNLLATGVPGTKQIFLRDTAEAPLVKRIGGADRFAVSAAVSQDAFGTGVPVAYVASGAVFADALSGSAAAGAGRGPVLLVTKDAIPDSVAAELERLKPQKIVVLGGPQSVGSAVEDALADYSSAVSRIDGPDRYDVSAAVSAATFPISGPIAYVASGQVFPDALSGSAAAGQRGGPVLLVQKGAIPASVATELTRLKPSKIVVLGGTNTIADSIVLALTRFAPTSRVDGADRFAVSAAVSAGTFPGGAHTVYVASGAVFPDALSGSAAAIQNDGPVLLVTADTIPAVVVAELERLDPTRIVVLGGTNTASDTVLHGLERYLHPAT